MALSPQQTLGGLAIAAYFAGSIPFGLLVGRLKGIDVRKAGSGNIGATNVGRLLGKRFFFLVFLLDMLKGLIPMVLAATVARRTSPDPATYAMVLLVGFATIAGHMFSVFLGFKGGKGVATSAGVILGLWPYYTLPGVITIAVFIIVLYVTRYVSVGSMAAAVMFPVVYLAIGLARGWDPFGRQLPLMLFAMLMAVMIVYKHRGNIARLRAGTESRLTSKRAGPPSEPPLAA
jgi:glycerol-3-phosphate acyltransferase PlsY